MSRWIDNKAMSSAKSRSSKTEVRFHRMPVLLPTVFLFTTQSIDNSKRKADMVHPCFTLDWTPNHSVVSPSSKTAHSKLFYIAFTRVMSSSGISNIDMIFHRLSRCIESNAFSKSMKWVYRVAFHSLTCSSIFLRVKDQAPAV